MDAPAGLGRERAGRGVRVDRGGWDSSASSSGRRPCCPAAFDRCLAQTL